jgi:hypothetical protein
MVWISKKQKLAMDMIGDIANEFGYDRWFTQCELLGITKHTMDALVFKRYLERVGSVHSDVVYYRRLKELGDES